MYNFFKHQQSTRQAEAQRRSQDLYSQWLLKNQDKKQEAKQRQKQRVAQWIEHQSHSPRPQHIEDDHFRQWRHLKQFRDIENQPKFLGYKTFRHKPSNEMNKYYTQRQRKEMFYTSIRKQPLVDSNIIEDCQRNRSLRSQGPLNPKIQFRQKKREEEYLNPKMTFKARTDKERMNESKMQLDQKLNSIYSSFEMKRSTIGVPTSSYFTGQLKDNRSRSSFARYDIDTQKSYRLKVSVPNGNHQNNLSWSQKNKIHFESNPNNYQQNLTESKMIHSSRLMTAKMPQIEIKNNKGKTYWKLAKTMELKGDKEIKDFLLKTQYDRKKDLSNLKMNMTCENYIKRPVL